MKSVFISFHCDEESVYYILALKLFIKQYNSKDLKICAIGNSINSANESYIKRIITNKINSCDKFICLVSKNTHFSSWVNWEIDVAYNLRKKIFVIKIHDDYVMPSSFHNKKVNVINSIENLII